MSDTDTLRSQYAAAIHQYDNHHGLSGNDRPSDHHRGEADAVLAVRDQEMEQLRAGIRELASALAAETHNNSPADLITKGHAARRISALLEGEPS